MARATAGRGAERRQAICQAALRVALLRGLRATTMEAIAQEAGVAKPTLYSYFADKDAVFAEVAAGVAAEIIAAFDAALAHDTDVVRSVGNALAAKYKLIARLLADSPHADELYSEHGRGAAAQFEAVEHHIAAAVQHELDRAGVARPHQLSQLLLAAVQGVARRGTASEIGPAIRLLTERLVGPELGR